MNVHLTLRVEGVAALPEAPPGVVAHLDGQVAVAEVVAATLPDALTAADTWLARIGEATRAAPSR